MKIPFQKKINPLFIKLSLIIICLIVLGATSMIHYLGKVYAQAANAWNIQRDGGNNLNFFYSTGGANVLQLTSGGRVGINTNTPGYKLTASTTAANDGLAIFGTNNKFAALFTNLGGGAFNGITQANDQGIVYSSGGAGFVIAPWLAATGGIRLDTNGNVGINKPTPVSALDVLGGASNPTVNSSTGSLATFTSNTSLQLQFGALPGAPYSAWIQSKADYQNRAYPLGLNPAGGEVGIGTAAPNGKLDIYNSTPGYNGDGAVLAPDINMDNNFTIQTYIDATVGSSAGWPGRNTYANRCCNNLALQPEVGTVSVGGVSSNYTSKFQVFAPANYTAIYGFSPNYSAITGSSTDGTGVYATSTNGIGLQASTTATGNWAGWFFNSRGPSGLYIRADGAAAGWTTQIDRVTDAAPGGGMLLLNDFGPRSNPNNFFIYAQSDANQNQGGADVEFYVRGDGYTASDNGMQGGGADVAEWTPSKYAKEMEPGDLVMIDGSSPNSLTKKSDGTPYSSKLMGIVSTNPGLISGGDQVETEHGENDVLVALVGRVPTKVSTENGPIEPGDFLTSSSIPGVAMKATHPGMVVGKALESFNNQGTGKILVWVQPLWYGGNQIATDSQQQIDNLKKELNDLKQKIK